jgi:hypothetical protein
MRKKQTASQRLIHGKVRFRILAVILLVFLCFVLLAPSLPGWLGWGRYGLGPPLHPSSLHEVSKITSLQFPSTASLIDCEYLGGPGNYLIARIKLPRADLQQFLSQHAFGGKSKTLHGSQVSDYFYSVPGFQRMLKKGWRPYTSPNALSADGYVENWTTPVHVLICLDQGPEPIIYLHWLAL